MNGASPRARGAVHTDALRTGPIGSETAHPLDCLRVLGRGASIGWGTSRAARVAADPARATTRYQKSCSHVLNRPASWSMLGVAFAKLIRFAFPGRIPNATRCAPYWTSPVTVA